MFDILYNYIISSGTDVISLLFFCVSIGEDLARDASGELIKRQVLVGDKED